MAYEKKSWSEFRETGLFHFVNSFLHLFGWAIVLSEEDDGSTEVFPARTDYRGFPQESNDKAYNRVTEFLRKEFQSAPVEAKTKKGGLDEVVYKYEVTGFNRGDMNNAKPITDTVVLHFNGAPDRKEANQKAIAEFEKKHSDCYGDTTRLLDIQNIKKAGLNEGLTNRRAQAHIRIRTSSNKESNSSEGAFTDTFRIQYLDEFDPEYSGKEVLIEGTGADRASARKDAIKKFYDEHPDADIHAIR